MSVTAIIPARNEENTVSAVIGAVLNDVDEVIVVDSCSSDQTAQVAASAGARVVQACGPGKHRAVREGLAATWADEVVFLDADLLHPPHGVAKRLIEALRASPSVAIAKACYERPLGDEPSGGGRLTELCARPLLALLAPQLASLRQPLAGEYAFGRRCLSGLRYSPGFAVDLGILLHCSRVGGIVEVDLGVKRHKHRPLHELGDAAVEVAATILRFAGIECTSAVLEHHTLAGHLRSDIDLQELPALPDEVGPQSSTSDSRDT